MGLSGIERRKFPRVHYPCLIIVKDDEKKRGDDAVLCHTENVGCGGVCVTTKKNIKLHTVIELQLDMLDFRNHIKCKGKVVWCLRRKRDAKKKPLFYDVGVEFQGINEEDQKRIAEAVDRVVKNNTKVSRF